jgi:pimeloyl-ACP methyl ester carboxylesterase
VINDLREMLEKQPQAVVAAHSQGSLIAAVAIHGAGDAGEVKGLITYGSQLGILYPRMFPGAGIDDLVDSVAGRVSMWVNLWRDTDPIGGHYVDRAEVDNRPVGTASGHSGYETTPEYLTARRNVVGIEAALGPQAPEGQ